MTEQVQSTGTGKGLGVAGLILGIIGIAIGWIPVLCFVGLGLAIIGLIVSIIGMSKAGKAGSPKGTPIAGLILSIGALGLSGWMSYTTIFFVSQGAEFVKEGLEEIENIDEEALEEFSDEFEKEFEEALDDAAEEAEEE